MIIVMIALLIKCISIVRQNKIYRLFNITRCGIRNENRFQFTLKATVSKPFNSTFQCFYIDISLLITQSYISFDEETKKLLAKRPVEPEMPHAELLFALTLKASEPAN